MIVALIRSVLGAAVCVFVLFASAAHAQDETQREATESTGATGQEEEAEEPAKELELPLAGLQIPKELPEDPNGLSMEVAELVALHPGLLRAAVIGESAGGRPLWVIVAAAPGFLDPNERPALMLAHWAESPASNASNPVLGCLRQMLASNEFDLESLLSERTLLLAPQLNPDRVAGDETHGGKLQFNQSFPARWQPESIRPGSGPYPLSSPESLAVVEFLDLNPMLSAVAVLSSPSELSSSKAKPALPKEFMLSSADAKAGRALLDLWSDDAGSLAAGWPNLASPGSLIDWCVLELGLVCVSVEIEPQRTKTEIAAQATPWLQSARWSARLLQALPRIRVMKNNVVRLGEDLWQLDLSIWNPGPLGVARTGARGLTASISQVDLLYAAGGLEPSVEYALHHQLNGDVRIGALPAGVRRNLRLVVRGAEAEQARIELRAPRAATFGFEITLIESGS